jgi:flagellin-specific chaperone FliS
MLLFALEKGVTSMTDKELMALWLSKLVEYLRNRSKWCTAETTTHKNNQIAHCQNLITELQAVFQAEYKEDKAAEIPKVYADNYFNFVKKLNRIIEIEIKFEGHDKGNLVKIFFDIEQAVFLQLILARQFNHVIELYFYLENKVSYYQDLVAYNDQIFFDMTSSNFLARKMLNILKKEALRECVSPEFTFLPGKSLWERCKTIGECYLAISAQLSNPLEKERNRYEIKDFLGAVRKSSPDYSSYLINYYRRLAVPVKAGIGKASYGPQSSSLFFNSKDAIFMQDSEERTRERKSECKQKKTF